MDQGPLVTEEIDAGRKLIREFDAIRPVKAAFWLKASDDDYRYLYLASDEINDGDSNVVYRELLPLVQKVQSPFLDPFRVRVIGGDDPLAKAAVDIYQRFPGALDTRFGGSSFGGASVDDVYIYRLPLLAAQP